VTVDLHPAPSRRLVPLDDEMIDEYARALITRLKWLTASETLDRLDIMIRARSEFEAKFGIAADRGAA